MVADVIVDHLGPSALELLAQHPSDTARGWACFMIGNADDMKLSVRLAAIRPYADDPHFGVREWSWMAVRPHLTVN